MGKRLTGKHAIVTGGSSGIGKEIVKAFVNEGCIISVFDINPIKINSDNIKYFHCDITSEESLIRSIKQSVDFMGSLEILVNNAGIGVAGDIMSTKIDDWHKTLNVNLTGTYLTTKHSMNYLMDSQNGSIINIASVAGVVAVKDRFAYTTSKGGVISLTKSVALDYVTINIRANAICPGTVNTPWVDRITKNYANPDDAKELMRQRQPLGRLGEPEEIAMAAVYLASDESKFITGTSLIIDGGLTMS